MKKPRSRTATAKSDMSRVVLRSSPVEELSSLEERLLRMKHGIGLDPHAPLGTKATEHPEAGRALLEAEAEVLAQARRRAAGGTDSILGRGGDLPEPTSSRLKDKIVRALRRKS